MKLFKNKKIKIILLTFLSSIALIIPTITLVSCSNGSKENEVSFDDILTSKIDLRIKFMDDFKEWNRQNGHNIPIVNSVPGNPEYVNATLSNFEIECYSDPGYACFSKWDNFTFNEPNYYTWQEINHSEIDKPVYKVVTKTTIPLTFNYRSTQLKVFSFTQNVNIGVSWTYYCFFE